MTKLRGIIVRLFSVGTAGIMSALLIGLCLWACLCGSAAARTRRVALTGRLTESPLTVAGRSTGSITGEATNLATSQGIEGVEVCTIPGPGSEKRCTETGASGTYKLTKLAPGEYLVEFTSPLGSSYERQHTTGYVKVQAGKVTANIDEAFAEGGRITGIVTSVLTHSPVEGVEVCAEGGWEVGYTSCTVTNTGGEYTIAQLPTHSYVVEYKYAFEGAMESRYVTPEYYKQHVFAVTEADRVEVTAGATTAEIDEELEGAGQISGRVISAVTKLPLAGIEVCAVTFERTCTVTPATGDYIISHIVPDPQAPDEYRVLFRQYGTEYLTRYYNDAATYGEAEVLAIPPGGTQPGIDAEMVPACTEVNGKGTEARRGEPTYIQLSNSLTTNLSHRDSLTAHFGGEARVRLKRLSSAKCRALDEYEPFGPEPLGYEFIGEGAALVDGDPGYTMRFTLETLYGKMDFDFTLWKDGQFAGGKESVLEETTEKFS